MNIGEILKQRLNLPQIRNVASWASGSQENIATLWALVRSDDRRTSVNALWAMTHLPETDAELLSAMSDDMTDMLMAETDTGKKRMLLRLLCDREYETDDIRTDLLEYCMSKINSECEPYAVRCLSIYTAYKMCRYFPELIAELEEYLEMMQYQALSPGLMSALRQTKDKILKLK